MKYNQLLGLFLLACFIFLSCKGNTGKNQPEIPESVTRENEWIMLFDGTSTAGWRGFNQDSLPAGWVIEDGALKGTGEGGDIVYGNREFENFELSLEWKISEGGNSGIFYHVREGDRFHAAYENAPEYQLIDDTGFPADLEDWQKTGADYAMYAPDPEKKVLNPPGEWNTSRIVYTPKKVEYYLNGNKVIEFVHLSHDWHDRVKNGKWKDFVEYGKAKKGLIGLQDHDSPVWFREIRISII